MEDRKTCLLIIANLLGYGSDELDEEFSVELTCMDDLDLVEIVMLCEDRFGIEIPDDDPNLWASKHKTIKGVIDFILSFKK